MKKLLLNVIFISGFLICITASSASGEIIYVDEDANGLNDGSSWPNAYNYLQDSLINAQYGDYIWIAEGTYKPDRGSGQTPGNREATFQIGNGVCLYGGYAGHGEPDPNLRDVDLYQTILSGDLAGNDCPDTLPKDLLEAPNRSENSYHVVTISNTEPSALSHIM